MSDERYYVVYSDWTGRYRSTVVPYSFEPYTDTVTLALASSGYTTREKADAVAEEFNRVAGL